jgi:serine protease Do
MSRPRNQALGLAAGALLSLFVISLPDVVSRLTYAVQAGQAFAARDEVAVQNDLSAAFKRAARIARPSVVHITSTGPSPYEGPGGGESRGVGTGVIVRENGYILTNNHVVAGASDVNVKLSDGRVLGARVMGTDEKTDLAVVKVEATGLVAAQLGDSDRVEIGEWVLAMGNPFGLEHTVTAGIISAKGRANVGIADYEDFLQTDAAINPGNSGGPLLNLEGKVIGINTAIASRTGGYMGVGFAIPISMAQVIMDQIIKDGKVVRGYIGAMIQDLPPEMSRSFEFEGTEGALVNRVVAGGPAARAGLRDGDIVLEVNGRKVSSSSQLRNTVAAIAPGTRIPLKVFRQGKELTVDVAIGNLAGQEPPS